MNKLFIPTILAFILIIGSMFIIESVEPDDAYTLTSDTGCCSISVVVTSTQEYDTLYTITYTDITNGDQFVEVETREVDAEYMIGTFQDHCYTHHN